MSITIRLYPWPSALRVANADVGYDHAQISGRAYFSGRPQGETLALPKRRRIVASGPLPDPGLVEVMRYALSPNNLVHMTDPVWAKGRAAAVAALARDVVWDTGANWATGAAWGPYIGAAAPASAGDRALSLMNLPANVAVFRTGDVIGVGGVHHMVAAPASTTATGTATVRLVRGVAADVAVGAQIEFPVKHLFSVRMGIPRDLGRSWAFEWDATFTEVFKSEFSGVSFAHTTLID
jgi:hypothetical protein